MSRQMPDRQVTIATFAAPEEAHIARNFLIGAGITTFLADETAVGMAWHLGTAIGGVKLRVAERDVDRAVAELKIRGLNSDAVTLQQTNEQGDVDDSRTKAANESESPNATVARAFRATVIGLFFIPLLFYSLWLLIHVATGQRSLSVADQNRAVVLFLVDLVAIAVAVLIYWLILTQ